MSTWAWPRSAMMVPSRWQAISTSTSAWRAWFIAIRFSRRSSVHLTGRLRWRAANGIRKSSGIELAARAEAAADVVLDHLDGVFRQADLLGEDAAVEERHLGGAGDRQPPRRRVPLGHDAARLHGEAVVAAGAQRLAANVRRVLERGVGVAEHGVERQRAVGARSLEQQALIAARVRDRRQRVRSPTSITSSASSPIATLSAITTAIGSPT